MELSPDKVDGLLRDYLEDYGNLVGMKNLQEIIEFTKNSNDPISLNNMGFIYEYHYQDYKKAEEYYLKAIELGNSSAFNKIGFLYTDVYKDFKKAVDYYTKAIELGDKRGYNNIGNIYRHRDNTKAEEYYQKACEVGHKIAYLNLANLYEETCYIEEARKWYEKYLKICDESEKEEIQDNINRMSDEIISWF